jgi:hypothetical protein
MGLSNTARSDTDVVPAEMKGPIATMGIDRLEIEKCIGPEMLNLLDLPERRIRANADVRAVRVRGRGESFGKVMRRCGLQDPKRGANLSHHFRRSGQWKHSTVPKQAEQELTAHQRGRQRS